jgi:hypothetical protein
MSDIGTTAVKFLAEEITKEFTSEIKTLRIAIIARERKIQDIMDAVRDHGHAEDALSQQLATILGINEELPERNLYTDEDTVKEDTE